MNLDFLKNLTGLSEEDKLKFKIEDSLDVISDINSKMKSLNEKVVDAINQRLATGNCYIKDDILFERKKGGDKAIWFPKGNAVEYQVKNGIMPASFLKAKQKLQKLIDKKDKPST